MMLIIRGEICSRYKRNGCKLRHISILAQLNAIKTMDIIEILHESGLYEYNEKEFEELDNMEYYLLRISNEL